MFIVSLINREGILSFGCALRFGWINTDSLNNLYINQVRGDDYDYYEAGVVKSFVRPRVDYIKIN